MCLCPTSLGFLLQHDPRYSLCREHSPVLLVMRGGIETRQDGWAMWATLALLPSSSHPQSRVQLSCSNVTASWHVRPVYSPVAALGAREDLGKMRPPRSLGPIALASAIQHNRCDRKTWHLANAGLLWRLERENMEEQGNMKAEQEGERGKGKALEVWGFGLPSKGKAGSQKFLRKPGGGGARL